MKADSGLHPRIWLFLLSNGGRWAGRDLAEKLGEPLTSIQTAVQGMTRSRMLEQHERTATVRRLTYSVTATCRMPQAVTVADVVGASAYRPAEAVHCGAEGVM